jgi:hypothetical protein
MRAAVAALGIVLVLALLPAEVAARSERVVGWPADRVFATAVRFLRIDEGVRIVERDAEAGYILFELSDDGKAYRGALELVIVDERTLRMVLRLDDRPAYMEIGMLDRLERKLRVELGPPPRREPARDPAPGA